MKLQKKYWQIPFLILLIVGSILIIWQQNHMPYKKSAGNVFGTQYHIIYQHNKDLKKEIELELQKVDDALSTFNKSSIISKINSNQPTELNTYFVEVFDKAKQISAITNGAFDITVAPLVNAWGFGFTEKTNLSVVQIDSIKQFVGYNKIRLKGKNIVKDDPRLMIDCSAIAKGYGVDVVANLFKSYGIQNFMIEIGGEVITRGVNKENETWKIGVNKPNESKGNNSQEIQLVLNLKDKAMATSGNYRNFYYKDGKKYAHTISPQTGYPVSHSLLSATVIANECAIADAFATAFMVLGVEKSKAILEQRTDLQAYFIYSDDKGNIKEWMSEKLKKKIVK